MVTCRETVGDCGRSLSQTSYFSEDRRCSRLPTDTTVKSETERSDTASVSITKRAPLSFQSVRPTGPVVSVLDGDTIEVLHNQHPERIRQGSLTKVRNLLLTGTGYSPPSPHIAYSWKSADGTGDCYFAKHL